MGAGMTKAFNWDEAFEELAEETRKTNDAVASDPKYQEKGRQENAKIKAGIGVLTDAERAREEAELAEEEDEE
jgi:hypothetical protein